MSIFFHHFTHEHSGTDNFSKGFYKKKKGIEMQVSLEKCGLLNTHLHGGLVQCVWWVFIVVILIFTGYIGGTQTYKYDGI